MMDPRTVTSTEVYILYLNDDGSPRVPREYVYIDPQTDEDITLRFSVEGTSPICRHGSLWINVPEEGVGFKRDEYREYPYVSPKSIQGSGLFLRLTSSAEAHSRLQPFDRNQRTDIPCRHLHLLHHPRRPPGHLRVP